MFFFLEKKKIAKVLGLTAKIEHIGSTAVPGLGGKGIVDIVVGVSQKRLPEAKNKLQEAGYEFRQQASCPERLFFRIDHPYNNRTRRVHVHLTVINGKTWNGMTGFRNFLLKHPDTVDKYVKIKKKRGLKWLMAMDRNTENIKKSLLKRF